MKVPIFKKLLPFTLVLIFLVPPVSVLAQSVFDPFLHSYRSWWNSYTSELQGILFPVELPRATLGKTPTVEPENIPKLVTAQTPVNEPLTQA